VDRLTRERIAPRAAEYDQAGQNPVESWRDLGREGFLAAAIPTASGGLFGSWGSEPAVSLSRTFLMETAIREDGDGYVVDGVKYFCTMALGASHYMVWCALDGGTDMSKSLLLALVPAGAPGIATDGRWNTLGMRATYSPSVSFTGVRVPRDAVLGDPGAALRVGVVESFPLGYAAVYLGIAEGALAFAID
jgi:hypothetical protein